MRILYIITKSGVGGAQTHVLQLSRYCSSRGDKVLVMAHPGGWLEKELEKNGIDFYPNRFFANRLNPFLALGTMKEIKKVVDDFQPDLISCHSTAAGFWGRLAVRNKVPTIFTAHGWSFTEGTPRWRRYPAILAERFAARYADKIICVSDFGRQLAISYKVAEEEKLAVVHNGVELVENKGEKPEGRIKIVFIGRLSKQKDPELFLQALNELSEKVRKKVEVLIVGDGKKRKKLRKFIKKHRLEENAKLLGRLERGKIFEILQGAHIFILTSHYEGFPRTILEAMSCGLAVIATDVGGVSEAVDKDCGILVKRGDRKQVVEALTSLIERPELVSAMGKRARQKVEENFSLRKMCEKTYEVYEQVLSSRNKFLGV